MIHVMQKSVRNSGRIWWWSLSADKNTASRRCNRNWLDERI